MPLDKYICGCGWKGESNQLFVFLNPYSDEFVKSCPNCGGICDLTRVCDEPNCWSPITCGTPTPLGYRETCGEHMPKAEAKNLIIQKDSFRSRPQVNTSDDMFKITAYIEKKWFSTLKRFIYGLNRRKDSRYG